MKCNHTNKMLKNRYFDRPRSLYSRQVSKSYPGANKSRGTLILSVMQYYYSAFIQRRRMEDTVVAKCSSTFCLPFEGQQSCLSLKEAVIVLLMVMEEVWRIQLAPQDSLSKSHIISVRDYPTVEMAPIILNGYKKVKSEVNPLFYLTNYYLVNSQSVLHRSHVTFE